MKNKVSILVVLAILLFLVLGCGAVQEISKVVDKNAEPKVIKSQDNKVQLTVPKSWSTTMKLHEEASLEVSQPLRELYTVIIPDSKVDFDESADLDFVAQTIRTGSEANILDSTYTETISLKINGFDARQFEVFGTVEKIKINYIFTIVETPDHFQQIVSWTLKSKYTENKPVLLEVINSFDLAMNGSGSSDPPPAKK